VSQEIIQEEQIQMLKPDQAAEVLLAHKLAKAFSIDNPAKRARSFKKF
jgi:hypothetical protein